MSKKKYVVNLGLNRDGVTEAVIEDILVKANEFIIERLNSLITLGRNSDVNVAIQVVKDEAISFEVLLEVTSPMPIPLEYEVAMDRVIDEAFKLIGCMLSEAGSNAVA